MPRPTPALRAAVPALAVALAAACADGPAAPSAAPPERPNASLTGGGGGTTPPPETCTIVSCAGQIGGGQLAATRYYPDDGIGVDSSGHDVVTLSPSGAVDKRLTIGKHYDYLPTLSPDGTRMAFASRRGGGKILLVHIASGYMSVVVTTDTSSTENTVTGLSWSPDGKLLTFAARKGGKSDVFIVRADGSTLTQVTDDAYQEMSPVFTRDGMALVFASTRGTALPANFELWRTTLLGGSPTRLTTTPQDERWPSFAPDGTMLYQRTDKVAATHTLLLRGPRGYDPEPVPLVTRPASDSVAHPSFSHDGAWVAYGARDAATQIHGVWRLPAAGAVAPTRVTPVNVDYTYPRWMY